ncbi:MAG: hypothetical protein MJ209_00585 [archaeon]|nr:hypothetical protein [archaeon]
MFFIIGALLILFNTQIHVDEFWVSMCFIFGVLCLVIGAVKYVLFNNDKYAKSYKINEEDERYIIIRERSAYMAFTFSNVVLAILTVFCFIRHDNCISSNWSTFSYSIHCIFYFNSLL